MRGFLFGPLFAYVFEDELQDFRSVEDDAYGVVGEAVESAFVRFPYLDQRLTKAGGGGAFAWLCDAHGLRAS